jgi:hypothetical protein
MPDKLARISPIPHDHTPKGYVAEQPDENTLAQIQAQQGGGANIHHNK